MFTPPTRSSRKGRSVGPLPWLGWKQLFFPVLFVILVGIDIGVLTSVGHSSPGPTPKVDQPIPVVFVFSTSQGTISHTSGANYTISMQDVNPTVLSYGGSSSLSILSASVLQTSYVVAHWSTYKFAGGADPHAALVPSIPSTSSTPASSSVAVTVRSISYDPSTQILTVQGTLIGGASAVSNIPAGFAYANFYVDSANGLTIAGCTIQPGTTCAGAGGSGGQATPLIGQNFAFAQLSGSIFSGADLTEANFANANFSGANLANAILTQANLTNSSMPGANLTGATFNSAIFSDASLFAADAPNALFRGATLAGANLSEITLTGADLTGADLSGALINEANLTKANFTDANLTNVDLSSSQLQGANFTDANLTNANLDESGTTSTIFNGAFYCNTTMPDGSINNPGC